MTSSSGETRTKVTLKETGTTDTSDGFKPPEKPASANRSKVPPDPAPVRPQPYHGSTLEDLKYEVLSLRQKHEILEKEVARIRKDKIKPMELRRLKSRGNISLHTGNIITTFGFPARKSAPAYLSSLYLLSVRTGPK